MQREYFAEDVSTNAYMEASLLQKGLRLNDIITTPRRPVIHLKKKIIVYGSELEIACPDGNWNLEANGV